MSETSRGQLTDAQRRLIESAEKRRDEKVMGGLVFQLAAAFAGAIPKFIEAEANARSKKGSK